MGVSGPWSRPGEPAGGEAPARGGVGTPLSSAGGVGALLSSSTTILGGGVLAASSFLVGVLAAALAGAGCSSALVAAVVAAGCSVVCGAASPTTAVGSAALWTATWSGSTSDAALNNKTTFKQCQKQKQNAEYRSTKVRLITYRSERLCVAVNLLMVLPVGACAPVSTTRVGSVCGAGGSLDTRTVVTGATSGRLRGLRTREVTASSSSSSSSSVIQTSRRRFGA